MAETRIIAQIYNGVAGVKQQPGVFDIMDYGAFADQNIDDSGALNRAIAAARAVGGGTIFLSRSEFSFAQRVRIYSNIKIVGLGCGITTIYDGVAYDYMFYSDAPMTNFTISDITIDLGYVLNGSGIQMFFASNCTIERCKFKNCSAGGWFVKFGVMDGGVDNTILSNNTVRDCVFENHAGSLEMLLVFNNKSFELENCTFTGNTGGGPILGLWQKTSDIRIKNCKFINNNGICIYYSLTCDITTIDNCYFENSGEAIQGTNESDNGSFGEVKSNILNISNCNIVGGANSVSATAVQLGAVNIVTMTNTTITKYNIAININKGNSPVSYQASNITIRDCNLYNNNASGTLHSIHPAILFSAGGGSLFCTITGGAIYDDQATKTQRYCIGFNGNFTWDWINISGVRLSADTANGGTSIVKSGGAVLGSNVKISNNMDYSGANPAQN